MFGLALVALLACLAEETTPVTNESAKIEFSADVSRLMKLIINSLYSNKEIFLRELISNCADAMNKVKIEAQTNPEIMGEGEMSKLDITIMPDEDVDTLTIIDRGIGMSREELIQNLGTVAHSGTFKFFEQISNGSMDADLIGQFGVGFYSSFLVADKVVVTSKRYNETQYVWTSTGAQAYTVEPDTSGENLQRGTKVVLHLQEKERQYANTTRVKDIIMKYSQFIDFPIYLRVEQEEKSYRRRDDDDDEPEPDLEYVEPVYDYEHVNLEPAIWLRDPNDEISDGDYIAFFHTVAPEFTEDPRIWTHFHQTIDCNFKSILYIPGSIPKLGYSVAESRHTRLRLYIKRVLITERLENFLPRFYNFVRGVVDSDDLPLNVSREMLQETRAMKMIARKIIRKIIQMMNEIAERSKDSEEDEDPYLTFYRDFGAQIKLGVIEDRDNRKKLSKLLRFNTTKHEEYPISLDEYVAEMKADQTEIYYIAGDPSISTITRSPFLTKYRKKDQDVIFFPETMDELIAKTLRVYDGKPFVSITESNKNTADSENEKTRLANWKKEFRPLTTYFKRLLKGNVTRVEVSMRLAVDTKTPCVLSAAEGSVSPGIAAVIRMQEEKSEQKSNVEEKKVLEINPRSDLIRRMNIALREAKEKNDQDKLEKLARMMFETALIDNGYHIEDPTVYADHVFEIMTKMTGLPHAPVMPDDLRFDFDQAALREEEEEREALRREKLEKRQKRREEKRRLRKEKERMRKESADAASEEAEKAAEEAEAAAAAAETASTDQKTETETETETEESTSEEGKSEEEFDVDLDTPLDEQEELFAVLDEGAGPQKTNSSGWQELFVEDPDDKTDRLLEERRQKRLEKQKRMEKSKKKKEAELAAKKAKRKEKQKEQTEL